MKEEIIKLEKKALDIVEPKKGMEYIYNLDMSWPIYKEGDKRRSDLGDDIRVGSQEALDSLEQKPYSIAVDEGIIVVDVISKWHPENLYHDEYEFTLKDSGIRCRCNYAWAFWENTPENIVKINEYKKESEKLSQQELLVDGLRESIEQLRN